MSERKMFGEGATSRFQLTLGDERFSPVKSPHFSLPCPLCTSIDWSYLFVSHGTAVFKCRNCGLTRLDPEPTDKDIRAFYSGDRSLGPDAGGHHLAESGTELQAAISYLDRLEGRHPGKSDTLLIAAAGHPFTAIAQARGYAVVESADVSEIDDSLLVRDRYQTVVVLFQMEKATNPIRLLERLHESLIPGGVILIVAPAMDSWSARFFRGAWTEWRPENRYYFDTATVQSALLKCGFHQIEARWDRRRYSIQHLYDRACAFPRTRLTSLIRTFGSLVPSPIRRRAWLRLPSSGIVITARRAERRPQPLLSIIMPVYNERATLRQSLDAVIAKKLDGVEKEIIVVESNSTDGSHEIALEYENRAGVTVICEDEARGKGRAVRTGLEHARGDIVLIQDADNEYDVNDYDALIKPLLEYRAAFVLGSRHSGDWKIRNFNRRPLVSTVYNFGHALFVTLLNLLYGQKLRDPFTMYKVFRRDCLFGLQFECNRFDFDFELVIKLVRKGYSPLEIPVNYSARSYAEGKKVSFLRDPLTWVLALAKYRVVRVVGR